MKKFQTGSEKIQKICDMLRRETLEPAEENAERIIGEARAEAEKILQDAKSEADRIGEAAKDRIAKERAVFHSSMEQGCRQAMESLRQSIEQELFNKQLGEAVTEATGDPKLIASLVNALVEAVEKEGLSADFAAIIPETVKKDAVAQLLLERVRSVLAQGLFKGGAKIQLKDQKVTIDVSDETLVELLGQYIRKDYREILFG